MSTKPKALEIADAVERICPAFAGPHIEAAAELRRLHAALEASEASDAESLRLYRAARERADKLHALNAQMLEALKKAQDQAVKYPWASGAFLVIIEEAIAAAKEQS